MKVTMKDVAREARVSTATVSHVINKTRFVEKETKNKVLIVMRKLSYYPNAAAQSLRSKKTKVIGLIVPDISNFFFTTMIKGIERTLKKYGYNLILSDSDENIETEKEQIKVFNAKLVDGLIIAPASGDHIFLKKLLNRNIPIVFIDRIPQGYCPVSLFKAQLLIWLGEVKSNRSLAESLQFDSRFCVLCGFDNFLKTPAHSTFSYFKKRIGIDIYYKILHRLIAQTVVATAINKINISSKIIHIIINSNNGQKKNCNCSGIRCKYNKKRKFSKDNTNVNIKLITKNFVALGFKAKMVIDTNTQLPVEVTLIPKK